MSGPERSGDQVATPDKMTPLQAKLITDRPALADLEGEWNDLLRDSASDTIFLTWEWISAWLDAVHPDAPLLTVAVRDADARLIAIAPYYVTTLRFLHSITYRTLRVLGDTFSGSEYPDVIVRRGYEPEAIASIFRTLSDHGGRWDCIWMPKVAGWTGARQRIAAACVDSGFHLHEREIDFSAAALPDTYEAYFQELSGNARSMLRRRTKRILEQEGAAFVECKKEAERPDYLDALFALNDKRWSAVGQRGTFIRKPAAAAFYRTFTPVALARGWLRLYGLKLAGSLKAVQIGYVYNDTFHQLQEGFDPGASDGIGNVLRRLAIERLIGDGVRSYDFLGGDTEHKRRWSAVRRIGHDLFVGRRSLRNKVLFAKEVWPTGRYLREQQVIQ